MTKIAARGQCLISHLLLILLYISDTLGCVIWATLADKYLAKVVTEPFCFTNLSLPLEFCNPL